MKFLKLLNYKDLNNGIKIGDPYKTYLMDSIAIQIPQIQGEQEIEVDVKINGVKSTFNYRIEIFFWSECKTPKEDRAGCIREMVLKYDSDWELVHIGSPSEEFIPITFRKRKKVLR